MSKSKRMASFAVAIAMLVGSGIGQGVVSAAEPMIEEPVTIEFWFQSDVLAESESWQRAIERFNEVEPNVTVNMTSIPFTDFERQMPLALSAGTGPDVATVPPLASGQDRYVEAGGLLDLTSVAQDMGWLDNYPEWAVDFNNSATPGQVYGIPYAITDEGLFYNGDMFDELGVEAPQSFEELETLLQTLTDAGVTPLSVGGRDGWPLTNDWGHFVQGNIPNDYAIGLEALDPELTYDDPRIVAATEAFVKWFQEGFFAPNSVATDYNTANSMFVNEEVAMTLTGTWALAQFVDEADFEARFSAFPPIDPGVGWNDSGLAPYNNIVIPTDANNKEAAIAFIDYILSEGNQQVFWDEGNLVSYQFDEVPPPANLVQADVYDAMAKVVAGRYMGVSSPEMLQVFTSALQRAVNGDISSAEAVKDMEEVYRTVVDG